MLSTFLLFINSIADCVNRAKCHCQSHCFGDCFEMSIDVIQSQTEYIQRRFTNSDFESL